MLYESRCHRSSYAVTPCVRAATSAADKYYLRVLPSVLPRRDQVPLLPERLKALLCVANLRRQVVDNLVLLARLVRGNGPDQYTEDRLRDHIRNGVADLLRRRCCDARKADHLHDVHAGVGTPRDDREPARVGREGRGLRLHLRGRIRQADGKLPHDIEERDHRHEPPQPAAARLILNLPRVAEANHHRRRHPQRPRLLRGLLRGEPHHQDQLDEQERHREQPVHVAVRVVEREPGELDLVAVLLGVVLHVKRTVPRVEDAEVVIRRNERDDTGDNQRRTILLLEVRDLQPEENRRTPHPCDTEGEGIVDRAPAAVVPAVRERCHANRAGSLALSLSLEPK